MNPMIHEYNVILFGNDGSRFEYVVNAATIQGALTSAVAWFETKTVEQFLRADVLDITLYNQLSDEVRDSHARI